QRAGGPAGAARRPRRRRRPGRDDLGPRRRPGPARRAPPPPRLDLPRLLPLQLHRPGPLPRRPGPRLDGVPRPNVLRLPPLAHLDGPGGPETLDPGRARNDGRLPGPLRRRGPPAPLVGRPFRAVFLPALASCCGTVL